MNVILYRLGMISHGEYTGIVNSPFFHIVFIVCNLIVITLAGAAIVWLSFPIRRLIRKAAKKDCPDDVWDGSPFTREEFHNAVIGTIKVFAISSAIAAAFYFASNILTTGLSHFMILDEYRYFVIEHGILTVVLAAIYYILDKRFGYISQQKKADYLAKIISDDIILTMKNEKTAQAVHNMITEEIDKGNAFLSSEVGFKRQSITDEQIVLTALMHAMIFIGCSLSEEQVNWVYNIARSYGDKATEHGHEILSKLMDFLEGCDTSGRKVNDSVVDRFNKDDLGMYRLLNVVIKRRS